MADPRDLEAQLAAIDDRLRELQAELDPGAPAGGSTASSQRGRAGPLAALLQRASRQPSAETPPELARELDALTELHRQVLEWIHELIAAYEGALARRPRLPGPELTISAGPFADNESVDAFVAAIQTLPGVARVTMRGFEGADRAIIEVQLS